MKDVLLFMGEHPIVTVIVVWVVANTVFRIINRIIRCINIGFHGYPPPHCDADGDFKPEKDDNEPAN